MKKHWVHLVIAGIFLLFAVVQGNDPDWYLWVPIYFLVVGASISYYIGKPLPKLYLAFGLIIAAYSMRYVPGFIQWINEGMPSIVTEMKADTPFVEHVREFLGLVTVWVALLYYFSISRTPKS